MGSWGALPSLRAVLPVEPEPRLWGIRFHPPRTACLHPRTPVPCFACDPGSPAAPGDGCARWDPGFTCILPRASRAPCTSLRFSVGLVGIWIVYAKYLEVPEPGTSAIRRSLKTLNN